MLRDPADQPFHQTPQLAEWSPSEILLWAVDQFPRRGFTCSFGGTGIILAHMIGTLKLPIPVYFLNTGYLFRETLQSRDAFAQRYGLTVVDVVPDVTVEEQAARLGPDLYRSNPDMCCQIRKVDPMQRLLQDLDAWISGLRRDQSGGREGVDVVERHTLPDGRAIAKLNPLALWTKEQCWDYIRAHGLPYNPLLDRGYRSIGCWPCTVRVGEGQGERDGRWAGTSKTECGLHTFTKRANDDL